MVDDGSGDVVTHVPQAGARVAVVVDVFIHEVRGQVGGEHVAGVRVEGGRRSGVGVNIAGKGGGVAVGQDITGVGVGRFFVNWLLFDDVTQMGRRGGDGAGPTEGPQPGRGYAGGAVRRGHAGGAWPVAVGVAVLER